MPRASPFRRQAMGLVVTLWLVTLLPYAVLYLIGQRQGRVFVGLIYNLYDGLSYFAKMQQGYHGAWRFRLPYTADAEPTAYLFVFHLALGHLARILHVPIPVVYHAARLLGGAFLVVALGLWFRSLREELPAWRAAWTWSVWAVGMEAWGFLVGYGSIIPELYPFLSTLANAHFPWALAFLTLAMHPGWLRRWQQGERVRVMAGMAALGLALALLAPFGVLVAGTAWGLWALRMAREKAWPEARARAWMALWLGAGAVPYLAYVAWVVHQDPWLAGWNAQNQTPIEGFGKTLFLFSPWWILALLGWWRQGALGIAGYWIAAGWAWALAPLALQRRMWLGMAVPLVALAMRWLTPRPRHHRWMVLVLLAPTWALMIGGAILNARFPGSMLFLSPSEWRALQWMARHLPPDQRVLTGPETGPYVPAFTGHRVFYGHIFETYPAEAERTWVVQTLCEQDGSRVLSALRARSVQWVLWTPRESALCSPPAWLAALTPVWREGGVTLYRVKK